MLNWGQAVVSLWEGLIHLLWIRWHQISLREGQPGVNLLLTGFHELQDDEDSELG